jgi:uncharacterized protein (DUF1684 family)
MTLHYHRFRFLAALIFVMIYSWPQQAQETHADSLAYADIHASQAKLNAEFADREESPLLDQDFENFKSLAFFPADLKYRVMAHFTPIENAEPFEMSTTTDRKPMYRVYGTLDFEIENSPCRLTIYQNLDLMKKEEYQNYLFIPFTDLTNSTETYGGGRYLDLELPLEEEVLLDFNKAYNPYCAYNYKYSCPIPPMENDLNVFIKAGVKRFH